MSGIPDQLFGVAVVPFIVMLIEVVKNIPRFNHKFSPLVALGFGLAFSLGWFLLSREIDVITAVIWGLIYGLTAIGGYSSTKNIREALR